MLYKIHVIGHVSNASESILVIPTQLILFYMPHSFTGRLMQGGDQKEQTEYLCFCLHVR